MHRQCPVHGYNSRQSLISLFPLCLPSISGLVDFSPRTLLPSFEHSSATPHLSTMAQPCLKDPSIPKKLRKKIRIGHLAYHTIQKHGNLWLCENSGHPWARAEHLVFSPACVELGVVNFSSPVLTFIDRPNSPDNCQVADQRPHGDNWCVFQDHRRRAVPVPPSCL